MDLLIYLAKASLLLALFWVVYKVFLEAETYHRFKRIYLHVGYLLSLILPLLTYTKIEEISLTPTFLAPSSSEVVIADIEPSHLELAWSFITEHAVLELLYIGISLLFLVHLTVKFFRLLRFLKASNAFHTDGIFHIQKSIPEGAFSFLNYIVYDPKLYSETELKIILAHEKAHVAHKHSLDMLFAHLYKCAFWFNPFAWLYQKSLVLNLEYEADAKVVAKTTKKDYQLILYSITQQQFRSQLQHSFHQSPIKKRIAMLNKNKHNRSFWKLFIVSPLLVAFFLLFQVETIAQIKEEPVTTSETKVNRIEMTFDENTTKKDLESSVDFLKEDLNIDMKCSNLKFDKNNKLKSLALEVDSNDGFKGSVSSPDVAKQPVYFYRDYTEGVETPFGVGIRTEPDTISKPDYNTIKDAENLIINGNQIDKEELAKTYIPVETYSYDNKSKTLSITTRPEFSKPYFSKISAITEELVDKFGKNITEKMTFINVSSDHEPILITLDKFKISEDKETPLENNEVKEKPEDSKRDYKNAENFVINGKRIDREELVEKYIPVEDYSYDANSKTLSIKNSSAFSEPYYPQFLDLMKAMKGNHEDNFLKGLTYFKLTSDYKVATMQITDVKTSETLSDALVDKNISLSNGVGKTERKFLDYNSKYQNQDMVMFVDGVKVEKGKTANIDTDQIESVETLKSPEELKAEGYNSNFVKGVIKIKTKKVNDINASQYANSNVLYKSTLGRNDNSIIYKVDGEEVDYKKFTGLDPEQIQSMIVVKSPYDLKEAGYDPKKIDGIIEITTKNKDSKTTDKIKIRQ